MYICGRLLLKQREADPAASGINVLARALIVAVNGSAHVAAAPGGGPSEAAASPAARRAGPKHRQAPSCPAAESVAYALYSGIIKALGRFPAHHPVLEAAERAIACVAEGLNGISVPVAVPETTVAARIAQIVDHAWTVLMVIAQPERASNLEFNRRFRALLLFFGLGYCIFFFFFPSQTLVVTFCSFFPTTVTMLPRAIYLSAYLSGGPNMIHRLPAVFAVSRRLLQIGASAEVPRLQGPLYRHGGRAMTWAAWLDERLLRTVAISEFWFQSKRCKAATCFVEAWGALGTAE
jgi:hypothetical protein